MANRDYSLTAYVRTDNTEGNFSLEDISFQEYRYDVQDESEYSLLSLSSDNIFLNKEENSVAEFVVYSETGSWSATVPADVLSYLDIANKRTGLHATTDNNVLTGLNLDTVVVTTLSDISEHPTSMVFDIPFTVSNDTIYSKDVFNLQITQSNGKYSLIDFTVDGDGGNVAFSGYCELYRMDGSDSTLLLSTTDSTGIFLDPGTYRLSGSIIHSFYNVLNVSSVTVNSSTLNRLHISNAPYLRSLDLSQAPNITILQVFDFRRYNEDITSFDFSNLTHLRTLEVDGFRNLESIDIGDGHKFLQSFHLDTEKNISVIDLSECTALTDVDIISKLDTLILSNCTALETLSIRISSIEALYLDGCTGLTRLTLSNALNLEVLDMTGLDNLRVLDIHTGGLVYSNTTINSIDLTILPSIDSVNISNLDALNKIEVGDGISTLRYLNVKDCAKLTKLDLSNCTGLIDINTKSTWLDSLILTGCTSLSNLEQKNNDLLKHINTEGCSSLKRIHLYNCGLIDTLNISGLYSMDTLILETCHNLKYINLKGCSNLSLLDAHYLSYLYDIDIDDASYIRKLDLYKSESLATLDMRGWHIDTLSLLDDVTALDTLNADNSTLSYISVLEEPFLRELRVANTNIKTLPDISFQYLKTLDVSGSKIENLDLLEGKLYLSEIDTLRVNNCSSLKTFRLNQSWPSDNVIDLSGCTSLDSVYLSSGVERTLDTLNLSGCSSLSYVMVQVPGALENAEEGLILDGSKIKSLYLNSLKCPVLTFSNSSTVDSLFIGTSYAWDELINLYVNGTEIKAITIRNMDGIANVLANDCPQLAVIDIMGCANISNINIDNSTGIKFFRLWNTYETKMASKFSISQLTSLEELHLSNIEHITRLDMRNMPALQVLDVQRNRLSTTALTSINCTGLTRLRELRYNSSPDSLYLDNCSSLTDLAVSGENVKILSINGLTQLDSLVFKDTEFETITLPDMPSLKHLNLDNNISLSVLNIPATNQIETLRVHQTSLNYSASSFNLANTLRSMSISDNQSNRNSTTDLLNLSNYTKLESFSNGSIYRDADLSFDFSGCTGLKSIRTELIGSSNLVDINLSGCTSLVVADLANTHDLKELDITGCTSLRGLDLYRCDLDAAELNSIFEQLPTLNSFDGLYRIDQCTGESTCDVSIALEKKWTKTTNDISVEDYDIW